MFNDIFSYLRDVICYWWTIVPGIVLVAANSIAEVWEGYRDFLKRYSITKHKKIKIFKWIFIIGFLASNFLAYHKVKEEIRTIKQESVKSKVEFEKKYNILKSEKESEYNALKKEFETVKEDRAPKIDMVAMGQSSNSSSGVPDMIVQLKNKGKTTLSSDDSIVSLGFVDFDKNDISWVPAMASEPIYSEKTQNFNFDISQNRSIAEKATYAVLKINSNKLSKDGVVAYIYYRYSFKGAYDGWLSLDSYYGNTDSAKDRVISLIKKQGGHVHE